MENFWNYNELDQLHIELTNGCNAACPMCVRFHNSSPLLRSDLTIQQITLEKFKDWLPPEVIKKCRLILFCGVHGDPCIATDFYKICEYISDTSDHTKVVVNTNGGMRKEDWWLELGKLFAKNKHREWNITFSIDGLRKTNHIYRRNVNWDTLIKNVRAYNSSDNLSEWDFLVFRHNEKDIEKARKTAKKLGFTHFNVKKALGVDNGEDALKAMPALNKEGKLDYWIHAPNNPEYRNLENPTKDVEYIQWPFEPDEYRKLRKNKLKKRSWEDRVENIYNTLEQHELSKHDSCSIYCKSQNPRSDGIGKEVFIDCSGIVMPCCYMATHLNSTYSAIETMQLHKHMNDYGWEKFDLHNYSLEEILTNRHLDNVFANSWKEESVKDGKLLFCAMTCGRVSNIDKIYTHDSNTAPGYKKKTQDILEFHKGCLAPDDPNK